MQTAGVNTRSPWNLKKREIESRERGWLKRFSKSLNESHVREDPLSYEERRMKKMLDSGWRNCPLQLPSVPAVPRKVDITDVPRMDGNIAQTNYCAVCWAVVAVGPQRISCTCCSVVIHRSCIQGGVLPFITRDMRAQLDLQGISDDEAASTVDLSACPLEWVCPLCLEEVQSLIRAGSSLQWLM